MTTLISTVQLSGTADKEDRQWLTFIIVKENERRTQLNTQTTAENQRRAAATPPEAPLPLLPLLLYSTGGERKTSGEELLTTRCREIIQKYLKSALERAAEIAAADTDFKTFRTEYAEASEQKQAAALAAAMAALA